MRNMVNAAFGFLVAMAPWISAQAETSTPVVVVELYTSQGCSSCPPADDFFAELTREANVIPLSLHVDYWDYIGWTDTFADPKFTARQKAYARDIGTRTIYTPQMIVGGLDRVEGNNPTAVASLLMKHLSGPHPVSVTVTRNGSRLVIEANSDGPLERTARIQLVRYVPEKTVEIARGENAGRSVTYHNIVTSWQVLGEWDGRAPLELDADFPGNAPGVVIVQTEGPALVLAAARVN
jgi:hypothetical protein